MALLETARSATLPAAWYHDPAQYARELEAIWYRDWVCVGRSEELPEAGDYLVAEVGDERIVVTRDRDGAPRAFHNTCRHRGSILCTTPRGRFAAGRIACPYHAWSYALSGELLATPKMDLPADFRREDYALYRVAVDAWGGFLFVNLDERPSTSLAGFLGEEARNVERWPLADARVGAPRGDDPGLQLEGVLGELFRVLSLSGYPPRAVPRDAAVPGRPARPGGQPRRRPRSQANRGRAWRRDSRPGRSTARRALPLIEGPDAADRAAGVVFASFTASLFIVAHPDYVRSVRILAERPGAHRTHGRLAVAAGRRREASRMRSIKCSSSAGWSSPRTGACAS